MNENRAKNGYNKWQSRGVQKVTTWPIDRKELLLRYLNEQNT